MKKLLAALLLTAIAGGAYAQNPAIQTNNVTSTLPGDRLTVYRDGAPVDAPLWALRTQPLTALPNADYSFKTTDSGQCFTDSAITAPRTLTLPVGDGRLRYCVFKFKDGQALTISAQGGASIGVAGYNAQTVSLNDQYGAIVVRSITSTQWQVEYSSGNWNFTNFYTHTVPTNGGNIILGQGVKRLMMTPAAGIAGFTVVMPAGPQDGDELEIYTSQTITTLTLNGPSGETVLPTGGIFTAPGAANPQAGYLKLKYRTANTTWY